jgi:hypothetical protein
MNCAHCGAADQRGRFCIGCGTLVPPAPLPPRRVRLASRPAYEVTDDMTQPVLRLRHAVPRPRVPLHDEQEASA